MSTDNSNLEADDTCRRVSCGSNRVDEMDLDMKHPSVECQKSRREQQRDECMMRATVLRGRDLFEQPQNSHLGECPICYLPLPLEPKKFTFMGCCSQIICLGCDYANAKREFKEGLEKRCVFCREPAPKSEEEAIKSIMNRVKKNDPFAMRVMGSKRYREGDYDGALEYLTKVAELGYPDAHFRLSEMYYNGRGVVKDLKKYLYHSEEAAIGGHPEARHNLGCIEGFNGKYEKAKRHFIIAANLGYNGSLEGLRKLYANGLASKEDYADALRAYQAAAYAAKSAEREKAEEVMKSGGVKIFHF